MAPPAPVAAARSNKFVIDNDDIDENFIDVDVDDDVYPTKRSVSGKMIQ